MLSGLPKTLKTLKFGQQSSLKFFVLRELRSQKRRILHLSWLAQLVKLVSAHVLYCLGKLKLRWLQDSQFQFLYRVQVQVSQPEKAAELPAGLARRTCRPRLEPVGT